VVLDIGTGDHGILAQLALEAGASHVYAVELRLPAANSARRTLEKMFPGR
jgi:predicted RNA methylase